ncbi:hypothetical protein ACJX0J_020906, partial [Zea mays]
DSIVNARKMKEVFAETLLNLSALNMLLMQGIQRLSFMWSLDGLVILTPRFRLFAYILCLITFVFFLHKMLFIYFAGTDRVLCFMFLIYSLQFTQLIIKFS